MTLLEVLISPHWQLINMTYDAVVQRKNKESLTCSDTVFDTLLLSKERQKKLW